MNPNSVTNDTNYGTLQQRTFSLLINRIEIAVVSPHWVRLSIDWLDAVCPRIDVAYIWKSSPSRSGNFTSEEKDIIRQHYPRAPYMDVLKLLPNRTWNFIQGRAPAIGVKREIIAEVGVCKCVLQRYSP